MTVDRPGSGVTFDAVRSDAHLPLLRRWLAEPHLRPWWEVDDVAAYVAATPAHQRAWVVADAAGPYGYVETYRAADDPLADHAPVGPADRGWHVLVGDPARIGTGAAQRLAIATVCGLLGEPGVERVVCEPDVRNARMLAFCTALGGRTLTEFDFAGRKRAALVAWTRDDVAARWPDVLEQAVRVGRRWDALDAPVEAGRAGAPPTGGDR
ncbi:MAG: acetyltransferase [Solirubrobacteraceae bacterium]|nr:acetyltransferase [Solirubrobacteraceae bacterium]